MDIRVSVGRVVISPEKKGLVLSFSFKMMTCLNFSFLVNVLHFLIILEALYCLVLFRLIYFHFSGAVDRVCKLGGENDLLQNESGRLLC